MMDGAVGTAGHITLERVSLLLRTIVFLNGSDENVVVMLEYGVVFNQKARCSIAGLIILSVGCGVANKGAVLKGIVLM